MATAATLAALPERRGWVLPTPDGMTGFRVRLATRFTVENRPIVYRDRAEAQAVVDAWIALEDQ